jgi:hypothetical protein
MAKKTSKPKQLSPSDQAIYDAMPVSTQNFVNGISNPAAKSAYIQDWASSPAGKAASTGTTTYNGSCNCANHNFGWIRTVQP